MSEKTVEFEYTTEIQYKTLVALFKSFEQGSVNMDKFLIWVMNAAAFLPNALKISAY